MILKSAASKLQKLTNMTSPPTCKGGNLGLHRFHHWNCSRALLRCNPAANDVAGNTLDTLHGLVPWEDALQAWNEGLEP